MAEIEDKYPEADVGLIPGSGGVFEVKLDGHLIFSKRKLDRHADPGEVIQLVDAALGFG